MPLDNLRAFVDAIDAAGELARVDRAVSVDKEITEIADRCMKSPGGGPALLFRHPTLRHGGPSRYPVAVSLFGSARRMALAVGVECLDDIGERIAALLNLKIPDTLLGKLAMLPQLAEVAKFPRRSAGGRPPCQEVVRRDREVDLAELPIPVCWTEDGGPYITLPGVITRDPGTGVRNVGMYRILVLGGPFGDHTGFHSLADYYPRVHVTAVTMRAEPIWPHTIVGRPPMVDYWLGRATERIFLPLLKLTIPEIVDIHMPAAGIFHNLVFVSIDKQYPGQAYKVMNGLWGQGLMSLAKVIVVFDKDVNVQDQGEAWWVALNHIDPERDVRFTLGPTHVLAHLSAGLTFGSKMGIDATRKWKEEGFTREWPNRIVMDAATRARVDAMWKELGIEL